MAQPSDNLVGRTLRGYRIEKKLGQGGMGAVYQATHLTLEKTVALKVLPPEMVTSPEARDRFTREARVAARIDHPNVVTVHDVGHEEGLDFLVMQFVEGQSLGDVLKRHGPLPPGKALVIVREVAKGLAAAHRQGLVHRDVKPDNILITRDGRVLVADFGLARPVSAGGGLTQSGTILGTPFYMAPEQCEAREVDSRADLYALGVTLYQMLTGALPYYSDSVLDVLIQHKTAPIPDPADRVEGLPEVARGLAMRLMAKDPADRFQDAAEVVQAVRGGASGRALHLTGSGRLTTATPARAAAAAAGPGALDSTPTVDLGTRKIPWTRHRLAAAGGGAAALLVVVAFFLASRPPDGPALPAVPSAPTVSPTVVEGPVPVVPPAVEPAPEVEPVVEPPGAVLAPSDPRAGRDAQAARDYEVAHPDDVPGAISLWETLAERYPDTMEAKEAAARIAFLGRRQDVQGRYAAWCEEQVQAIREGKTLEVLAALESLPAEFSAALSPEEIRSGQVQVFAAFVGRLIREEVRFAQLLRTGRFDEARRFIQALRQVDHPQVRQWAEEHEARLVRAEAASMSTADFLTLLRSRNYGRALQAAAAIEEAARDEEATRKAHETGELVQHVIAYWDWVRKGMAPSLGRRVTWALRDGDGPLSGTLEEVTGEVAVVVTDAGRVRVGSPGAEAIEGEDAPAQLASATVTELADAGASLDAAGGAPYWYRTILFLVAEGDAGAAWRAVDGARSEGVDATGLEELVAEVFGPREGAEARPHSGGEPTPAPSALPRGKALLRRMKDRLGGQVRAEGANGISLTYDFRHEGQLDDFEPVGWVRGVSVGVGFAFHRAGALQGRATRDGSPWVGCIHEGAWEGDVAAEVAVSEAQGAGLVTGVSLADDGEGRRYMGLVNPRERVIAIVRLDGDDERMIALQAGTIGAGTEFRLRLVRKGTGLALYLNDKRMAEGEDPEPLPDGRAGFWLMNDEKAGPSAPSSSVLHDDFRAWGRPSEVWLRELLK
ncbi:MAG: serine/threonine protein kinase [Planctomycetes bacterium]|nr:serine/threonine protein kinase [Planctomycetota bacterium]